MTKREEVLSYGMMFPDVYMDTPFHDNNWVLLRYRKNKKAFVWTYERNGQMCVNIKVDPHCRKKVTLAFGEIPLAWWRKWLFTCLSPIPLPLDPSFPPVWTIP